VAPGLLAAFLAAAPGVSLGRAAHEQPAPGAGHGQPAPDDAVLRALLTEFLAGASRNDAAVHERFWAESLVYTRSTGVRVGKPDILKSVRAAPASGPDVAHTAYSAEDVRVQQHGDTAVVAFRLVGRSGNGGAEERSEYLNTGTFAKRGGRWQAVAWQATRVPLAEGEAKQQAAAADAALHAALLTADVKALEALLDPAFVWIHSDGRRLSGSQLLEQLRSGALRYERLDTSDVTASVHGSTAVVRGSSSRLRSSIPESPGTADTAPRAIAYTLVLAHDGSAWKAVAMHTSRLAGP
jgi:ketosteroid isomerase-like protein